uniref:receptor protein-tyrosine kinase n=2 Tax=Hydra vulgaris TaxID=6087 RepID=Q25199_HYDVU|nr:tyrosine kinase receptor [Hydra vulgaris]
MENYFGLYLVFMLAFFKVSNSCDNGWLEYKAFCYLFQNKTLKAKSWRDASLSCQAFDGHLLSIEDQAENFFILNILKDSRMQKDNYWIGLNDASNNREFRWSDDKTPQFFNWLPKKPNNVESEENCVEANSMGWNDNKCGATNGFICKIRKEYNDFCEDGWLNYKNYCYFFQNQNEQFDGSNWTDSYLSCRFKGGNLLSVEDQEENSFITSVLEKYSTFFWIGLNYLMSYKRFVWSDNSNWNPKILIENTLHPSNDFSMKIARCVVINALSWNIQNCKKKNGYICKVKRENNTNCSKYWFQYGMNCYYFQNTNNTIRRSWSWAYISCLEKGGNLLSIEDKAENAFILNILKNYSSSTDNYWIGLTDDWYNSWFLWSDNTYIQYSKFKTLLDTEIEMCVIMTKLYWETENCYLSHRFICKVKRATNEYCAEGWTSYRIYCYFIYSIEFDWFKSFSSCQNIGGNLLSIENQEENRFIENDLIKDNDKYWIGLNKIWNDYLKKNKRFEWSDNTYTQFFNWITNQPDNNNGIESCVEMNYNGWSDKECKVLNGFICKTKKVFLDYVNRSEELYLTQGFIFGTLNVLKKEYTISFNLKPMNYSKGIKNVFQLISSNNSREYNEKVLGIWFHEDGSGRLVIYAAVNGNNSYSVKTDPLILSQWSNIKIYQWLLGSKYWFAVDINGVNIHRVENFLVSHFNEIKIYTSNLWDDAHNGSISDLLIVNGKAKYIVKTNYIPLVKGKIIAQIPKLSKEYLVSFDFKPMAFGIGLHNIIYITAGAPLFKYGSETLSIWLDEEDKGRIKIVALINEKKSFYYHPIQLIRWSNIEVCQSLNGFFNVFTIRINGLVVFSMLNNQTMDFINVKIYASNIWDKVQNGTIKNFFIVNDISNLEVESSDVLVKDKTLVIFAAILAPVLVVLVAVIFVVTVLRIRKKKSIKLNPDCIEYQMGCDEITPDEWEIFPEYITLDKKIGEGAFGTVFIARLSSSVIFKRKKMKLKSHQSSVISSHDMSDNTFRVAAKLVKDYADSSELSDFAEEIKLMKEIGYHKNIVNLIGCSTLKKPLCLIVEYMEHGDLLNFLRKIRSKFCALKIDGKSSVNFLYTQGYQQSLKTTATTTKTEFCSGVMPNNIPLEENGVITPDDLLSFAWQVASGMEFLSCSKLVHRDLAARNILVGAGKNVKISDFGLTRKINDELNYMSKKKRRLPVKWMSVEAIFDQLFTSFSDVWAYGVVLFEIVTLGGTPYPAISNRELLPLLKSGYRMDKPENCSEAMYSIMLQCWNEDPLQRPTFATLRECFDKVICQGDCYLNFDFDENTASSFLSYETDNDDDNTMEDTVFLKPFHVKSTEDLKKTLR